MNKLDKFLTQVGGRFSTLTLNEGSCQQGLLRTIRWRKPAVCDIQRCLDRPRPQG